METNQIKMITLPGVSDGLVGNYEMMKIQGDTMVIKYSKIDMPPKVCLLRFVSIEDTMSLEDLLKPSNFDLQIIEGLDVNEMDDEFGQFYKQTVSSYKYDKV